MAAKKKASKPSRYDKAMVERINAHPVPADLMLGLAREITSHPREEQDMEGRMVMAIAFFDGHLDQQELSFSAFWRLHALMRIIDDGKLPGWTWTEATTPQGAVMTHHALIAAAAGAPVESSADPFVIIRFDREKFLQAAFQQAKNLPQPTEVE